MNNLLEERKELLKLRNKASFDQNFLLRDSYEQRIKLVESQINKMGQK